MMIRSADIKNYKGIEHLEIELDKKINLIIGDNGAGKTSLVQSLAIILNEPLRLLSGISYFMDIGNDVRVSNKDAGDVVKQTFQNYPVELVGKIVYNGQEYSCGCRKDSEASYESRENIYLANRFKTDFDSGIGMMPLLCYMGAGKGVVKKKKSDSVTIPSGDIQRILGYRGAFSDSMDFDSLQQWCVRMEFTEYQRRGKVRVYEQFLKIVSDFMNYIEKTECKPRIRYASELGAVVYDNGNSEQPVYQRSSGYQSVLCLIMELAYRAVILNPMLDNCGREIEGVVIIDEIDMHLHPAWQWRILGALRTTFPKVQFIVTTHSPIILSSAKDASVFMLKTPNEPVKLDSIYGYSVNDVLSIPQNSLEIPGEIKEFYDRAEDIFNGNSTESLKALIDEASEKLKTSPAVLKSFKDYIEVNRWIEEA